MDICLIEVTRLETLSRKKGLFFLQHRWEELLVCDRKPGVSRVPVCSAGN